MFRKLPDQDIVLSDAADFILDSRLGRLAICFSGVSHFPVILRDIIGHIHRLVSSCHMPEFTNHGLPHLCSLIDRISTWTCRFDKKLGKAPFLVDPLNPEDAATLLFATLIRS